MKTPDDVAEMLRLKACGWGVKRIARELGCSHHTVKDYVAAGGMKPFKAPVRTKLLNDHEDGYANGSSGIAAMPTWCARSCLPRRVWPSAGGRCSARFSPIGRR